MKRSIPGRKSDANFSLLNIVLTGKPDTLADFEILEKKRIIRSCYDAEGGNPKIPEESIGPDFP